MSRGGNTMPFVKLKSKGQMTLPIDIRQQLGLDKGDILEAKVQKGKIVLTPKEVMDRGREVAFERMEAQAARVAKQLKQEGLTQKDLQRMIDKEAEAVRAERYAKRR
jgi:AbrB family looped-hinge helix DNA binding protein